MLSAVVTVYDNAVMIRVHYPPPVTVFQTNTCTVLEYDAEG